MKKVLIIMPSMFIGGAERSLLGLLDAFDYDKYDVSLFLYRDEGEFLPFINKHVRILPAIPAYETFDTPIKTLVLSRKMMYGLMRLKAKLDQRIHEKKYCDENGVWMHMQKISNNLQKVLPDIPGEYDLGIMFLGVPDTLANKVHAKVKIAWNHTDYTTLKPDKQYDRDVYSKLDYIINVSEESRKQFLKIYPELNEKAIVIENILSASFIHEQAETMITDMNKEKNEICILSIGRFSYAKNFDNVPDIARRIIEKGINIKWYLIGYGGDENKIRKKIIDNNMEGHVVILGPRINPYPYIKQCDVYVQPSRFEGKSVAVREAQILGKPVIITDYASSESQLGDGVDGFIVPMENEKCAEGIYNLLNHQNRLLRAAENCKKRDYTNHVEIKKIDKLLV